MTEWTISLRKNFQSELLALPPKENAQIQKKLSQLVEDPLPDAKVKKQLKNWKGGNVYRIRSGDYRIFYSIKEPFISLLALRRRSEDTYDEEIEALNFGGPEAAEGWPVKDASVSKAAYWEKFARQQQESDKRPLPEPLTSEFLDQLFIPKELHKRLLAVGSEEELLDCPGVEDELLLTIHEALFEKPLSEVLRQPEFIADSVDDLFRYKSGDLPGFLLKLSPGQEALVRFNLESTRPTLVKGGPGSGKSTVALYRAAETARMLAREGVREPRILFTTYTNALTNVSNSLLRTLFPERPEAVVVKTADSLVREIIEESGLRFAPANEVQMREALRRALEQASLGENALERKRNKDAISRFSESYLLDEICAVVLAHDLPDIESYLDAPRIGRMEALSETERKLVWKISRLFLSELFLQKVETWSELRSKAAKLVTSQATNLSFDGVIVDEVQDLEPSVVSLLAKLSDRQGTVFLTADSRQSIYRSGFDWAEVVSSLGLEVEISELPGNYRSTEQIDKAAKSYFREGKPVQRHEELYAHEGPLPLVLAADDEESEVRLIARYIEGAAKELRLPMSSCVILVPTKKQGRRIASGLSGLGAPAEFSLGRELDITSDAVKVVPFQSAKGLEFPVVVIAGLWPSDYPFVPKGASSGEIEELRQLQRRMMYVAMTRAMRALMLVKPKGQSTKMLEPLDPELWDLRA
ncbi:3'-5' exonuclease [Rhodovulum sp. YNF3179]|uniref:3'-5' exonuclease n=1 Tax=Rhodovulum sp. YNF3179 TaxID=3425127 RepID=UPI003D351D21